jgi:c-di-GMP-binding flagellar brake protein YcgR
VNEISAKIEMRSAVRFPLKLPVAIQCGSESHLAQSEDISAGGLLFRADADLPVGSTIEFSIVMPAAVLGTGQDVHISCVGRVVRSSEDGGRRSIAAIIDEYSFERA